MKELWFRRESGFCRVYKNKPVIEFQVKYCIPKHSMFQSLQLALRKHVHLLLRMTMANNF